MVAIKFLLRSERLLNLRVILILEVILLILKKSHGSNSLGKTSTIRKKDTRAVCGIPSESTIKISEQLALNLSDVLFIHQI